MKRVKTIVPFIDLVATNEKGTKVVRRLNEEFEVTEERALYLQNRKLIEYLLEDNKTEIKTNKSKERRKLVKEYIKDKDSITQKELREALGLNNAEAKAIVDDLVKENKLQKPATLGKPYTVIKE